MSEKSHNSEQNHAHANFLAKFYPINSTLYKLSNRIGILWVPFVNGSNFDRVIGHGIVNFYS